MQRGEGDQRAVILNVTPEIDGGRFAVKRSAGESLSVEADVFADGHDELACEILWRRKGEQAFRRVPMKPLLNDRWRGTFTVSEIGPHEYTVAARIDHFLTWKRQLEKRLKAEQDIEIDLLIGAELIEAALDREAGEADQTILRQAADRLRSKLPTTEKIAGALDPELAECIARQPNPKRVVRYDQLLPLWVDRRRASFSAWYELFPRSTAKEPGGHGTFKDCIERLPYVAAMGFDVLYLPPIHPIGEQFRKGKNNTLDPGPEDVGSPWAIGSADGGHKAVHPKLGTLEDFDRLVDEAKQQGLEVALDIAFQCSPDHPYVKDHPEWFVHRPDGTIQYAENPPKKYQDIYPFNFECDQWKELWEELKSVFQFWVDRGVHIFRVDNPHTKPFPFWDWVIEELQRDCAELIFLAEAFTRPKVMYRLAKGGFSQSYTYFTWRNTKWELETYMKELSAPGARDFFRPNFWPNTPDILNAYLQMDGDAAFVVRLVLAATLSSNYGIYGPAFELREKYPLHPGSEEYLHSEKYQIREWNLEDEGNLCHLIGRINRIRNENEALQQMENLHFHAVDNPEIICYSKQSADRSNLILVTVNLDVHHTQAGWVDLNLEQLGLQPDHPFQVHDLVTQARYHWSGPRNYVQLDPGSFPAHLFQIRRSLQPERDFDYTL